ncbi:MAG TPA: phytanoyl-CoA dioxygenase family protein [Polyangium sp.]|nr:phytanoyl-CoA dioxygenase family protein [Polyangium sp.]
MSLTRAEQEAFARDGYLVRPDAVDAATVDALNTRLSQLITRCAAEHLEGTRTSRAFWDILRCSADDASVCWDTPGGEMPARAEDWESRAMRVGHGLHRVDDLFATVARAPALGGVLAALVPPPAWILQSTVVYKQPRSSAVQFGLHQDAAYLTTEPESLVLAFLALDEMDEDNGALAVVPGTHHDPLHVALAMGPEGFSPVAGRSRPERDYTKVLLPLRRGTAVFVHGRTLHASGPNRSDKPRRALIVHAMSGTSRLASNTWIQPPPGGFMAV